MEARNFDKFLTHAVMQSVIGLPLGDVPGFFLDIVLSSRDASVRLTGGASDLSDRTEAFLLTADEFDPAQRWTGLEGEPGWEAEDLLAKWNKSGLDAIWMGSRSVRYFFDPEDRIRGLSVQGPFDSAAAIELGPASGNRIQRLVFYSTYEYPCAVEVATTSERCDAILASLEEFTPRTTAINSIRGK